MSPIGDVFPLLIRILFTLKESSPFANSFHFYLAAKFFIFALYRAEEAFQKHVLRQVVYFLIARLFTQVLAIFHLRIYVIRFVLSSWFS